MWTALILSLVAFSGVEAINGKCRILAVGGGTDRGAYEAGAIIGLINNLPAGEAQWDIVTGIGTGAINALMVSQNAIGKEATLATTLYNFWNNFTFSQIYKDWIGWIVTGLKYESGLYDSSPMKKTITSLASGTYQRWLGVGTTDLLSANYVFFNSTGVSKTNMITGIYAAASNYGVFPFVSYNNMQLITGHIKFSVDILRAVNQCYNLGYTQSNIIVDVVLSAGRNSTSVDTSEFKTLQVMARFAEIEAYDIFMQVVSDAKHDFPNINIRTQIFPSSKPPSVLYPYDYTQSQLQTMLALGTKDAKTAVASLLENAIASE